MVKVEDDTAPPELSPVDGDDYYYDDEEEYDDTDTDSEGYGDGAARRRGGQSQLKKGPWTPEEDKRLADYVQAHGEGSWNQVRINAGLNRCGKSCRLRWSNHLRPDLKKVPLDAEEIEKIYRMHMAWGNKWAKMAAQLPGRTDNEIKNFWNTRLKRIQKSGLPIYPDHLHLQPSNQDMNFGTPEEPRGTKRPNEFLQDVLGISDLMHEYFNPTAFTKVFADMGNPPYPSDVHPNSLLMDAKPLKLLKSSGCIASDYSGSHSLVQIPDESEEAVCVTSFNYGMTDNQLAPFSNDFVSDYPIFDGNPSTSWTAQRPMKIELPSVQNSNYGLGDACVYYCPSGSFEVADSLIESPGSPKSESISSHYSLDAILYKGDGIVDPTMSQVVFEPPFSCNQVPQSNAHSLWHFTSVPGDDEIEGYPHSEIQASKPPSSSDAILAENKCNPDTSFTGKNLPPLAGDSMFDASLEASGIFDSFIDGLSYEEGKLSAAGHALDWSSMPGACNMSDFPNL